VVANEGERRRATGSQTVQQRGWRETTEDEEEKKSKTRCRGIERERERERQRKIRPGIHEMRNESEKKPYAALLNLHWIEIMARIKEAPSSRTAARSDETLACFFPAATRTHRFPGPRAHSPRTNRSSSSFCRKTVVTCEALLPRAYCVSRN